MKLRTGTVRSPVGEIFFAVKDETLCALVFDQFRDASVKELACRYGEVELRKERDPAGVATRSYGDVARAVGAPRAVRAVGAANGQNPISLVLPCHRIIRSDGDLCGYGGGLERKRWLLVHEGALLV